MIHLCFIHNYNYIAYVLFLLIHRFQGLFCFILFLLLFVFLYRQSQTEQVHPAGSVLYITPFQELALVYLLEAYHQHTKKRNLTRPSPIFFSGGAFPLPCKNRMECKPNESFFFPPDVVFFTFPLLVHWYGCSWYDAETGGRYSWWEKTWFFIVI